MNNRVAGNEHFWEHAYRERDISHPVVQAFARQRVEFLRRYLPINRINSALDVGCGSGFSTFALAEFIPNLFGLDRSSFMLRRHPFYPRRLILGDARTLPFSTGTFDLVYAWEVLHHFWDPSPIVREMARVSRRWVVLFEPCRYHPVQLTLAILQREHRPIFKCSSKYLMDLLDQSGLKCVLLKRVGWIFPNKTPLVLLPLLQRLPFESRLGISYVAIGEKR